MNGFTYLKWLKCINMTIMFIACIPATQRVCNNEQAIVGAYYSWIMMCIKECLQWTKKKLRSKAKPTNRQKNVIAFPPTVHLPQKWLHVQELLLYVCLWYEYFLVFHCWCMFSRLEVIQQFKLSNTVYRWFYFSSPLPKHTQYTQHSTGAQRENLLLISFEIN